MLTPSSYDSSLSQDTGLRLLHWRAEQEEDSFHREFPTNSSQAILFLQKLCELHIILPIGQKRNRASGYVICSNLTGPKFQCKDLWDETQGLIHARQVFYQLSYIHRPQSKDLNSKVEFTVHAFFHKSMENFHSKIKNLVYLGKETKRKQASVACHMCASKSSSIHPSSLAPPTWSPAVETQLVLLKAAWECCAGVCMCHYLWGPACKYLHVFQRTRSYAAFKNK